MEHCEELLTWTESAIMISAADTSIETGKMGRVQKQEGDRDKELE